MPAHARAWLSICLLALTLALGRILYTKEWVRVTDKPGQPHVGGDYRNVRRLRAKSLQPNCHRMASEGLTVGSICWENETTALGVDADDRNSHALNLRPVKNADPAYDYNTGYVWRHESGVFYMFAQRECTLVACGRF